MAVDDRTTLPFPSGLPSNGKNHSSKQAEKSWKVGVKTRNNSEEWVYNELRFEFREYAACYSAHLKRVWSDVNKTTLTETNDPPNSVFPVPSDRYPVVRDVLSEMHSIFGDPR